MEHLPIFINLKQKPVLVVGGGDIALRKINLLIKAQASVNCLSPLFCDGIASLSADKSVNLIQKSFEPDDIKNYSIIIASTDDSLVNSSISELAKKANIPIIMVKLDYTNKVNTISEPFYPTNDITKDFIFIESYFKGVEGKVKERSFN